MARSTKGGLGRGLSSLLGGTYNETEIRDTPPVPRKVIETEPNKPIVEKRDPGNVSRETFPSESESPIKEKTSAERQFAQDGDVSQGSVPKVPPERVSYSLEEDDKVKIKGIIERRTDEVPVDSILPNPDQPRTNFDKEELEGLAASIEKDGLLQPILVRAVGDKQYQIVAGERRWQACKIAGMKMVPVRIKDVDQDKALELALVENVQRTDLNPIEEAYGYRRLMERNKMTQADVAAAMSKGRSTVANSLRLLELPEDAQQLLFENKITSGHARAILSVPTKEGRKKLVEKIQENKLSVRETENLARLMSGKNKVNSSHDRLPVPDSYKAVAKALRSMLDTNVRVSSARGKNRIEIEFKDEADLERLFEELIAVAS